MAQAALASSILVTPGSFLHQNDRKIQINKTQLTVNSSKRTGGLHFPSLVHARLKYEMAESDVHL
jgi:hypothetical protein